MILGVINERRITMSEKSQGIPRNKIPWDPKIDYEKCTSCGKCVEFCHMKAFKYKETKTARKKPVVNPKRCVVLCPGCEDICPAGAITIQPKKKHKR